MGLKGGGCLLVISFSELRMQQLVSCALNHLTLISGDKLVKTASDIRPDVECEKLELTAVSLELEEWLT